jgi:CheY-like chemotaxis protein
MGKQVLVIDDNADLLMMLTAVLKTKGYAITVSETADNVIDLILEVKPDIILMDMLLSGTDGREICKLIKANPSTASVPLVMLSAYPQAITDCLAAGADAFIEKPFDMKVLLDTVNKLHSS